MTCSYQDGAGRPPAFSSYLSIPGRQGNCSQESWNEQTGKISGLTKIKLDSTLLNFVDNREYDKNIEKAVGTDEQVPVQGKGHKYRLI